MRVFHHNDADGRCAAAIVWKKFHKDVSDIDFVEMDYAKVPDLSSINKDEPVVIVDFSFKPDVMSKLLEITQNITWCDHHATAAEYDYGCSLAGYRDFSDKGLCGAECTWRHYFADSEIPDGLELLGDYDAWRMKLRPQCLEFYEGLKLVEQCPRSSVWEVLLFPRGDVQALANIKELTTSGAAAIRYRDSYCAEMRKAFGFPTVFEGLQVFVTNIYRFGSQGFGDNMQKYDACAACVYDGAKWTISLYSVKTEIDVSVVCKLHGGGGHKGAAGFVAGEFPFKR
jgi:oligoribonuclease NrnB/cAMP/cGMP phosphodiesterase (DHH superfamily)